MANSYADFMFNLRDQIKLAGNLSVKYVSVDIESLTIISHKGSEVSISVKIQEYSSTILTALSVESADEVVSADTTSKAIVQALIMLNAQDERKSVEPTINDIKRSIEETEGVNL